MSVYLFIQHGQAYHVIVIVLTYNRKCCRVTKTMCDISLRDQFMLIC